MSTRGREEDRKPGSNLGSSNSLFQVLRTPMRAPLVPSNGIFSRTKELLLILCLLKVPPSPAIPNPQDMNSNTYMITPMVYYNWNMVNGQFQK